MYEHDYTTCCTVYFNPTCPASFALTPSAEQTFTANLSPCRSLCLGSPPPDSLSLLRFFLLLLFTSTDYYYLSLSILNIYELLMIFYEFNTAGYCELGVMTVIIIVSFFFFTPRCS